MDGNNAGRTTNAVQLLVFTSSRKRKGHAIMIYPEKDPSSSYMGCLHGLISTSEDRALLNYDRPAYTTTDYGVQVV